MFEDRSSGLEVYEAGAHALLERCIETLPLPPRAQVWRHVRHGEPDQVIRTFADEQYADLIALGTSRRGFADRVIVGSVAESVLRHATCSVLIVPVTAAEEDR